MKATKVKRGAKFNGVRDFFDVGDVQQGVQLELTAKSEAAGTSPMSHYYPQLMRFFDERGYPVNDMLIVVPYPATVSPSTRTQTPNSENGSSTSCYGRFRKVKQIAPNQCPIERFSHRPPEGDPDAFCKL